MANDKEDIPSTSHAHQTMEPLTTSSGSVSPPNELGDIVNNSVRISCQSSDESTQPTNIPKSESNQTKSFDPLMEVIDKIADGERVPPQITMRYEMLRFCTLRSFPKHNKPYITRIAEAGFYYANVGDDVVCYCCAKRKNNWCEDDNPMEIHRELNPTCSFLLRNSEMNVSVRMSENQQNSTRTPSRTRQSTNNGDGHSTCDTISSNTSTSTSQLGCTTSNSTQNTAQAKFSKINLSTLQVDTTNSSSLSNQMHRSANRNCIQARTQSQQLQLSHMTVSNSNNDTPIVYSNSVIATSHHSAEGTNLSTVPKYPQFATRPARLTSFYSCGDIAITPTILATSGFFYAGFGDCVRCFQCGVGLRLWSIEDDPWIEHSRCSKDCLYVKQEKGQEFVDLVQDAEQYIQDENGHGQVQNRNNTGPDRLSQIQSQNPRLNEESVRLASFHGCRNIVISPESLAASGLFYTGNGDSVRCFCCGVGLHHWNEEDDPWIEHCRWSNDCMFVKQVKGQEFVNLVQIAEQYTQNQYLNSRASNNTDASGHGNVVKNLVNLLRIILKMGFSLDRIRTAMRKLRNVGGTLEAAVLIDKLLELDTCCQTKSNQSDTAFDQRAADSAARRDRCSEVTRSDIQNCAICQPTDSADMTTHTSVRDMDSFQYVSNVISLYEANVLRNLYNENQRLRGQHYCIECRNNLREVVFLSCPFRHLLFCNFCYLHHDLCPLCLTPVKALFNVKR